MVDSSDRAGALRHGQTPVMFIGTTCPEAKQISGAGASHRTCRLSRYFTAAFTSATTFFSTAGVHAVRAYDVGHIGPSSKLAASSKPSVE